MSRRYALCRLLEHGPLSWREIVEITGWTFDEVAAALRWTQEEGSVQKREEKICGWRRSLYELA
jgi:predicted transcriptional regulator